MKNPFMTPVVFGRIALLTAQEGQLPHATDVTMESQWDLSGLGDVWILTIYDVHHRMLYRWVINVNTVALIREMSTEVIPAWLVKITPLIFAPKVDAYKQEVDALKANLRKVSEALEAATSTVNSLFINISVMERELAKHG